MKPVALRRYVNAPEKPDPETPGRVTFSLHDSYEEAVEEAFSQHGVPKDAWRPTDVKGFWYTPSGHIGSRLRRTWQIEDVRITTRNSAPVT